MLRNYKLLTFDELLDEKKKQQAKVAALEVELTKIANMESRLANEWRAYANDTDDDLALKIAWREPIIALIHLLSNPKLYNNLAVVLGVVGIGVLLIATLANPIGIAALASTLLLASAVTLGAALFIQMIGKKLGRWIDKVTTNIKNRFYDLENTLASREYVQAKQGIINERAYYKRQLILIDNALQRFSPDPIEQIPEVEPIELSTKTDVIDVIPNDMSVDIAEYERNNPRHFR